MMGKDPELDTSFIHTLPLRESLSFKMCEEAGRTMRKPSQTRGEHVKRHTDKNLSSGSVICDPETLPAELTVKHFSIFKQMCSLKEQDSFSSPEISSHLVIC